MLRAAWRTACLWISFLPRSPASTDYPFSSGTRPSGAEQELIARNDGAAPITVYVTVTGENFASDRVWPVTAVVPPYTAMPLGRIYAADTGSAYNFLSATATISAASTRSTTRTLHTGCLSRKGQAYAVTQAHGGRLTSHNNRENLYAVDFAMPPGSAVLAARAGVVIDVTLTHHEGGYDIRYLDKANTVAIAARDDGTGRRVRAPSPGAAS